MLNYDFGIYKDLNNEIRTYLKKLRELSRMKNQNNMTTLKKVLFTESRSGFYNNEYVKRLVLFLKGTGCSFATETGGCTFCGFYNATNFGDKISDEDYILQIKDVINDNGINLNEYQIICIYNDGSMLKEEEISFKVLEQAIELLSKNQGIRKIVLEARINDITEEKIKRLRELTDKQLEIPVGFESANPIVRDLCVNKSFENWVFESKCELAKKYDVDVIPLLMLKPPFLSENEAINDFINSLKYLEKLNLKRIDMELPTIELYTIMNDLWLNNIYTPAKLWSVIKIVEEKHNLGLRTPLYISPTNYSVPAEAKAANCSKCNETIYKAFEDYNKLGDSSIFNKIKCSCKKEWEVLITDYNNDNFHDVLPKRVESIINFLYKHNQCNNETDKRSKDYPYIL